MSFGLANGPLSFQNLINNILHKIVDKFCTTYIDNILIYSNFKKKHQTHVQKVFTALQKAGLQADIDKYEFHITKTGYLGSIISTKSIRIDPQKVEVIQNWETLVYIRDVQTFIRFANFYHYFIRAFFNVVRPMIAIIKKNIIFY